MAEWCVLVSVSTGFSNREVFSLVPRNLLLLIFTVSSEVKAIKEPLDLLLLLSYVGRKNLGQ